MLLLCVLFTLAARTLGDESSVDPQGEAGGAPPPPTPPKATPRGTDATKVFSAGEREFRAKAYDVSIRLFSEALSLVAPSDVALRGKVLYARHKAYMSQQRLPQAIGDLSAVIEADRGHVLAHLQRANLELMTGRCAEAVADYGRVLTLDAGKKDAHTRMPHAAECKAALERAERAKAARNPDALRQALSEAMEEGRATSAPALLLQRAQAFLDLAGEENIANALADLARALKMDANSIPAYALRGRALMFHGDFGTGEWRLRAPLFFPSPFPSPFLSLPCSFFLSLAHNWLCCVRVWMLTIHITNGHLSRLIFTDPIHPIIFPFFLSLSPPPPYSPRHVPGGAEDRPRAQWVQGWVPPGKGGDEGP